MYLSVGVSVCAVCGPCLPNPAAGAAAGRAAALESLQAREAAGSRRCGPGGSGATAGGSASAWKGVGLGLLVLTRDAGRLRGPCGHTTATPKYAAVLDHGAPGISACVRDCCMPYLRGLIPTLCVGMAGPLLLQPPCIGSHPFRCAVDTHTHTRPRPALLFCHFRALT